jgi:hypothetical protein
VGQNLHSDILEFARSGTLVRIDLESTRVVIAKTAPNVPLGAVSLLSHAPLRTDIDHIGVIGGLEVGSRNLEQLVRDHSAGQVALTAADVN